MIHYILIDKVGALSSNDFLLKVLMPYAKENLADYIYNHIHTTYLWKYLAEAKKTITKEEGAEPTNGELIDILLYWIDTQRQHPAIQFLQSEIWRKGYTTGQYHEHIYEDVPKVLKQWSGAGIPVGIYTDKTIESIQSILEHTRYGNLNPYISNCFDREIGENHEVYTYQKIERVLGIPANQILFLSIDEIALNTAKMVGLKTIQFLRPGIQPTHKHQYVKEFSQINILHELRNIKSISRK
ncbi:MAG: acireductone synthase [Chitinophagales bacterium]